MEQSSVQGGEVDSGPDQASAFTFSWRLLALIGVAVGVASLAALVVVASVRRADLLATVAIALAVLAFVSQLVVFAAQSSANATQIRDAHGIQLETRAILSDIQVRAQGTEATLTELLDKVLDRALIATKDDVTEERREPGLPREELQQAISRARREIQQTLGEEFPAFPSGSAAERKGAELEALVHGLRTWPTDSGMRQLAQEGLSSLSTEAAVQLRHFATDLADSLESAIPDGLYAPPDDPGIRELVELGVISPLGEPVPERGGRMLFRLVGNKGRGAARLVAAAEPVPASAIQLFPWLSAARST